MLFQHGLCRAQATSSPAKAGGAASPAKAGRLLAVTRLDILIGSDGSSGGGGDSGGGGGSCGDSGGGGGPNLPTRRLYIAALDAWDGLTLEYTPTWPLHLLLTPQVDFQERRRLCAYASP